MKTEQVNIRLEADLAAALDRVAAVESLDRTTAARRLLENSLRQWQIDRAVRDYQAGASSIGRAAEEAGLSQWELLDAVRDAQVAHPLTAEDTHRRLELMLRSDDTLPDIPPAAGGVLLVGINPAPVSVTAGHYYQGKLGRRLWRRLEHVGLLHDPVPGAEDEAFRAAGHGLTDIVKRPTPSSDSLTQEELDQGARALRHKITRWNPRLVLFAFREPAARLLGSQVKPGLCGDIDGTPAFLLSGPYAPGQVTDQIDRELRELLGTAEPVSPAGGERTQRITDNDIACGQIRLPRGAKRFFPSTKGKVEIVLRGRRATATYDPRMGPDRERSAVLRVGELVRELEPGSRLLVRQGVGGTVLLD